MSDQGAAGKAPSELTLRILSAVILIAVVLTATWLGGPYFFALCVIASALVLYEFLHIVRRDVVASRAWLAPVALAVILAIWYGAGAYPAMAAFGIGFLVLLGFEAFMQRSAWLAGGLAYATLPLVALVMLRGSEAIGLHAVFFIFACVWGADTLAYFAGRTIGGPKLAPTISPKKTWSGFFGGLAGSVLAASVILYPAGYALSLPAVALMVALSIVSQMGDLLESWIKRRFDKKDSGRIIPGHGGIMDRIDGLITASIAAWLVGGLVAGDWLTQGNAAKGLFAAFILP